MDSITRIPFYVPNLLDNINFLRPVNQRGVTSWSSGYGLDRWIATNATIALTSGGITITPSGTGYHLEQRLEKGVLQSGKPYTAMLMASDGTCEIGDFDRSATEYDSVLFTGQSGKTYIWPAVWEGLYTANFHPAYAPKDYDKELAACGRYLRPFGCGCQIVTGNATYINCTFDTPMRKTSNGNISVSRMDNNDVTFWGMTRFTDFTTSATVREANVGARYDGIAWVGITLGTPAARDTTYYAGRDFLWAKAEL